MSAISTAHACTCTRGTQGLCGCRTACAGERNRYKDGGQGGTKNLFEDDKFPVDTPTLADDVPKGVVWRRPHELCKDPQVFVDGASRLDVLQGEGLGDCWLIAACSALADHPDLVAQIIPDDLELKPGGPKNNYTGAVTIHLWACGSRFPVVIDDRLPVMTLPNAGLKLTYGTCKASTEFWLPLVEKAIAKYQGGYKKLPGRQIAEGLIILTGYSVNRIDLVNKNPIQDLYTFLKEELNRKSLIIAAGYTNEKVRISRAVLQNKCNSQGDVKKNVYHSYTVNKVMELTNGTKLVRVRNPWGTEPDCTAKYRIRAEILDTLSPAAREELLVSPCSDGEYWVDTKGFYDKFVELCVANEFPSVSKSKFEQSTKVFSARGKWAGKTVGGNTSSDTFANNPQFLFQVDIEDREAAKKNVAVLVELIQDLHRKSSTPYESGFEIHLLDEKVVGRQQVGAAGLRRYSQKQLKKGADVLSPAASCGSAKACVVREFFDLETDVQHVVLAWALVGSEHVDFLLRVYTPAGASVRLSALPDPQ